MHHDFGIADGTELVPEASQFGCQLFEVIDLAIVDHCDAVIFVEQRLMSTREIDDRQASMAKPDAFPNVVAIAIRAAMAEAIGHGDQEIPVDRPMLSAVEYPC
jgi:hypothetical protein